MEAGRLLQSSLLKAAVDKTTRHRRTRARRLQREQRRTYVQQPSLRPESALQEFHEEVRERGGEVERMERMER